MAQLKLKQLKQKQLMMNEEYKLEIEKHEKKFNTELERLKQKKGNVDAQAEQFSVADEMESKHKSECCLKCQQNTLQEKMEQFFSSYLPLDMLVEHQFENKSRIHKL